MINEKYINSVVLVSFIILLKWSSLCRKKLLNKSDINANKSDILQHDVSKIGRGSPDSISHTYEFKFSSASLKTECLWSCKLWWLITTKLSFLLLIIADDVLHVLLIYTEHSQPWGPPPLSVYPPLSTLYQLNTKNVKLVLTATGVPLCSTSTLVI